MPRPTAIRPTRARLVPATLVALLLTLALGVASIARGGEAADAIRAMERTVASADATNPEKADAIRALAEFGRGRDAARVVRALFDILKEDNLLSDRELDQLEREYEEAEQLYKRIYDNVQDRNQPGNLRFSPQPEHSQEEFEEAEREVMRLRDRLRSNAVAKRAVVDALAAMRTSEARDEILEGVGDRNEDIAAACIEAVRRQQWLGAFDAVVEAYRESRNAGVRGQAVLCLRVLSPTRAKDIFLDAINDGDSWLARHHAVRGLRAVGDRDAVDALVQRVGAEPPGRLRWSIVEALERLTGSDFGDDPAAWRSWWAQNRDEYDGPAEHSGPRRDAPQSNNNADDSQRTEVQFYGVPVRGNPLFIIDRSGSMIAAPDARGGGQPVPPPDGELSKWDVCKRELFSAIDGLAEGTRFAIVFYDTEVHAYENGAAIEATEQGAEKRAVRRTIEPMRANGLTNIHGAFQLGFELVTGNAGRSGGPVFTDEDGELMLDEIFFLTDGSPTAGEAINGVEASNDPYNPEYVPLLLEVICEWNEQYDLAINTICIGMGNTGFMQELADRNSGDYVHVTE